MKKLISIGLAALLLAVWLTSCGGKGGATYQAPRGAGSAAAVTPSQTDQPTAPAGAGGTQEAPSAAPETPLTPQFKNPDISELRGAVGGGVEQPMFQTSMPPGGFHPVGDAHPSAGPISEWSLKDGLQFSSPPQAPSDGGYSPGTDEFTDPGTGYTYPVMAGEVAVVFSVPLNDPRIQEFTNETRTQLGGSLPFIRCLRLLLPPDTSVEYAVENWPQQYPDIIESVWPITIAVPA